jgi:hypothetical protein
VYTQSGEWKEEEKIVYQTYSINCQQEDLILKSKLRLIFFVVVEKSP